MKNKKLLAGLLIISTVVLGSLYLFDVKKSRLNNSPFPKAGVVNQVEKFSVEQKLTFGGGKNEERESVEVNEGERVLDIISRTKKIEIKEYSFGKLVESIEGVKNGTDNKYWIFYINGEESKVGAGEVKVKPNDKIEWKFKTYEE